MDEFTMFTMLHGLHECLAPMGRQYNLVSHRQWWVRKHRQAHGRRHQQEGIWSCTVIIEVEERP